METNRIYEQGEQADDSSTTKKGCSEHDLLDESSAKLQRLENVYLQLENSCCFLQNQAYDLDNHVVEVEEIIADITDSLSALRCDIKNRIISKSDILRQLEYMIYDLNEILTYEHEPVGEI